MNKKLTVAVLGLGEAGSHFANDLKSMGLDVLGFDPALTRTLDKRVSVLSSNREAAKNADLILSVNLASVSEDVAREIKPVLHKGQIFADMNTASPRRKVSINKVLSDTGVEVVDVAIMAPVPPKGIRSPFLISGPGASKLFALLKPLGLDITVVSDNAGDAATRKLLRSIVYKGFAAVIGEAVSASQSMGLESYMRGQISELIGGNDDLIDRFIEGSKIHALRRSHELEAVVSMLEEQRVEPVMSRATLQSLKNLIE